MRNHEYILALDPSGAFEEGQGTTGWVLSTKESKPLQMGMLKANQYCTKEEYWKSHEELIMHFTDKYQNKLCIVCEDYILYPNKSDSQAYSKMETCRLLGYVEMICYELNLPIYFQRAVDVKMRWSNDYLCKEGTMQYLGRYRGFMLKNALDKYVKVNGHILDAYKHARHFCTFKNNPQKKSSIAKGWTKGERHDNY